MDLKDTTLTDAHSPALLHFPSLTRLEPCRLHCSDLSFVSQLPELRTLHADCSGRWDTPADPASFVQQCSQHLQRITSLRLKHDLTSDHLAVILRALLNLQALTLLQMPQLESLRCFADVAPLPSLTELRLDSEAYDPFLLTRSNHCCCTLTTCSICGLASAWRRCTSMASSSLTVSTHSPPQCSRRRPRCSVLAELQDDVKEPSAHEHTIAAASSSATALAAAFRRGTCTRCTTEFLAAPSS